MQLGVIGQACRFNSRQFFFKQGNDFWIFITHIDVTSIDAYNLGCDQNAFNHTMRIIR